MPRRKSWLDRKRRGRKGIEENETEDEDGENLEEEETDEQREKDN